MYSLYYILIFDLCSGKSIRNTTAEFLATQTYIGNLQAYKKTLDKNAPTDDIDKKIAQLQANLGKFVNFSDSGKPVYIELIPKVAKSPQHIVILADKGTGSSAEYFLFIVRLPDYPVDNIGIQPDLYLDSSVKDWVEFALKYVEE
ncbi:hypothetical protein D3H65_32380 [Paraflavitalea soli]|uniref:Uncharacterized protein n=1 Tax=Paraflavitalea soli TaxID=2315862 RepID=A0A3B7MXY8_9BACT|nr:hypothetical protein [Paraflavitalea soli]AXY78403.1 hypothetical protein D3H65_32380 [Paraflavitalea soli]